MFNNLNYESNHKFWWCDLVRHHSCKLHLAIFKRKDITSGYRKSVINFKVQQRSDLQTFISIFKLVFLTYSLVEETDQLISLNSMFNKNSK